MSNILFSENLLSLYEQRKVKYLNEPQFVVRGFTYDDFIDYCNNSDNEILSNIDINVEAIREFDFFLVDIFNSMLNNVDNVYRLIYKLEQKGAEDWLIRDLKENTVLKSQINSVKRIGVALLEEVFVEYVSQYYNDKLCEAIINYIDDEGLTDEEKMNYFLDKDTAKEIISTFDDNELFNLKW